MWFRNHINQEHTCYCELLGYVSSKVVLISLKMFFFLTTKHVNPGKKRDRDSWGIVLTFSLLIKGTFNIDFKKGL